MDGNILFKSAMFGFHKEDVIGYMERVTKETEKSIAAANEKAAEEEAKNKKLEEELALLKAELEEANEKCSLQQEAQKALETQNQTLEALEKELSACKQLLEDTQREKETYAQKLSDITDEMVDSKQEKIKIANAMMKSQEIADDILHEATVKGESIRRQALSYVLDIKGKVKDMQLGAKKCGEHIKLSAYNIAHEMDSVIAKLDTLEEEIATVLTQDCKCKE